jgi:hypothetical protein
MSKPKKIYYDRVLMPIEVVHGDFCFGNGRCCGHFDNFTGNPTCDLNFYPLEQDEKKRIIKPNKCRDLKKTKG